MKRLLLSCCLTLAAISTLFAQPVNDDCTNAEAITLDMAMTFSTVDATTNGPTHPNCLGANDSIPLDVWYTYTPAEDVILNWSTCNTADFDTRMAVYATGDPCMASDDNLVACNDDGTDCDLFTSEMIFVATGGQAYTFRLGGYADLEADPPTPATSGGGSVILTEFESVIANDFCALAIPIELGVDQFFSTAGATTDGPAHPENPNFCFSFASNTAVEDIWYTYTADFTGTVFWDFCGMVNFDTRIAVYQPGSPCPPAASDLATCNDDGTESTECADPNYHSDLFFDVVNGETYLLRVGGYIAEPNGSGTFSLTAQDRPAPPANDGCENAIPIEIVSFTEAEDGDGFVTGTTVASSIDESNFQIPGCSINGLGAFADVWYSFESNGNTEVRVDIGSTIAGIDFVAELFTDCGSTLIDTTGMNNCLATDDDNPLVSDTITGLPPGENATIYLRVLTHTTFSPTGVFAVQVSAASPSAIRELDEVENLTLYPNPVQDLATVDFSLREALDLELEIFDLFGRSIATHQLGRMTAGGQRYSFDTSTLPAGMYTVLLSNGRAAQQMKMVVR
ncbi:MAG: T9SS type A sorting domain-containing protein [Bacteroidota bacterium]